MLNILIANKLDITEVFTIRIAEEDATAETARARVAELYGAEPSDIRLYHKGLIMDIYDPLQDNDLIAFDFGKYPAKICPSVPIDIPEYDEDEKSD
jgi:hypothetical protein